MRSAKYLAALGLAAALVLTACGSSSSSSNTSGGSQDKISLEAVTPDNAAYQEMIKSAFLGNVDEASLDPVVKDTLQRAAVPLTDDQLKVIETCIKESVCETGRGDLTIAIPSENLTNSAGKLISANFITAAVRMPQIKKIVVSDARGDLQTYLSNVRAAISQKADIIVSQAVYFGASSRQVVQQATDAGIVFVPSGASIPEVPVSDNFPALYVGTDVCATTEELANSIVAEYGENKSYAMFTGPAGNAYGAIWQPCLESALKSKGWTQAVSGNTDWSPQGERQAATALIASGKPVDALIYDFDASAFVDSYLAEGKSVPGIFPVTTVPVEFLKAFQQAQAAGKPFQSLIGQDGVWSATAPAVSAAIFALAGENVPERVLSPRPVSPIVDAIATVEATVAPLADIPNGYSVGAILPLSVVNLALS
jgi:ABC-type sugar transport system substrate-binding protein